MNRPIARTDTNDMLQSMRTRNSALITMFALGFLDVIIPVPIVALILIWVIVSRPPWFRKTVDVVYGTTSE